MSDTVYVVFSCHFDDRELCGVFRSLAGAKAWVEAHAPELVGGSMWADMAREWHWHPRDQRRTMPGGACDFWIESHMLLA